MPPLSVVGLPGDKTSYRELYLARGKAQRPLVVSGAVRLSCLVSVPAPSERLHNGLPCCLISVRRLSVLVIPVSQRLHPGCPRRRCGGLNAPDDDSVRTDDIVIVIALSAGATRLSLSE
jgi:hypothetical protein